MSIPKRLVDRARSEVQAGRAESLSAFVSDAMEEKLKTDTLEAILDAWDKELGPPGPEAEAWARRVLGI